MWAFDKLGEAVLHGSAGSVLVNIFACSSFRESFDSFATLDVRCL